jgi:hypothetical protein
MSMKICKITSILLASAFFTLVANTAFAGLGISPSQMITPNLSKGSHMERTFVLSRSDPKEDLYFKVTTEGSTKDWTTIDKGMEFTMPAGEQRFPIVVIVNVPKDIANGEYKGGIRLVSSSKSPDKIGGSGASTALSALIQTDFTITGEQVLEYEISSIEIQNVEEGFPLDVSITIINTGNVTARPTKVHVEVFDKLNKKLLESQDITEMGSVEPFETGDIAIPVPTKLGIDQYWTRISAYKDEALLKEQSLVFEIVEVGSLQKNGNLKEILCNKEAAIGETVKITGVFENTGQFNYSAKLVAEIYKNGKLVKLVESELASVNKGQTENLTAYFTPDVLGEYIVKAHVAYSGGKTLEKEFKIFVGNVGLLASVGLISLTPTVAVVLLILIVAIITIAVYFKKKRTTKKRL